MNKKISDYVFWNDEKPLTGRRHIIFLDRHSETEGTLKDGRNVNKINGKWTLPE
jgi:hypothetical protein